MYARVIRFVLGLDTQWEADRMADIMSTEAQKLQGCSELHFFSNYDDGEYMWISIWETEEDREESIKHLRPKFQELLGDNWDGIEMFQVYGPSLK